jgi:YD repeat-containing protein
MVRAGNACFSSAGDCDSVYSFNALNIKASLVVVDYDAVYQYDGVTVPRIINTTYDYDWFGNPRTIVEQGDIAVTGDERTTRYTYAYNKDAWIMDKSARVSVYDANGEKIKESTMYYDSLGFTGMGSYGRLTRREEWNDGGENPFMRYTYDAYGNVVSSTDSAGNSAYQNYDASHTYLASSINALGHITRYAYDLGTGNLLSMERMASQRRMRTTHMDASKKKCGRVIPRSCQRNDTRMVWMAWHLNRSTSPCGPLLTIPWMLRTITMGSGNSCS